MFLNSLNSRKYCSSTKLKPDFWPKYRTYNLITARGESGGYTEEKWRRSVDGRLWDVRTEITWIKPSIPTFCAAATGKQVLRRLYAWESKNRKIDWKFNIPLSLHLPLMCTPGVSHSAWTMGSEAYVAVTITSAPLTHSSLLSNALAHGPSSAHNAWALSNVLFHTRTCWNVLAYM